MWSTFLESSWRLCFYECPIVYKLRSIICLCPFPEGKQNLTCNLPSSEINGMCYKIPNINRSESNQLCLVFVTANFPMKWCYAISNHKNLVSWILFTLGLFTSLQNNLKCATCKSDMSSYIFSFPLICHFWNSSHTFAVILLLCLKTISVFLKKHFLTTLIIQNMPFCFLSIFLTIFLKSNEGSKKQNEILSLGICQETVGYARWLNFFWEMEPGPYPTISAFGRLRQVGL